MTKRKNFTFILAALFVVLAVIIMGVFCGTPLQASAATTSLYNIRFSYTAYRGVYISTATTVQASGTNVLQSDEIQCSKSGKQNLIFQIYGSSYSGTGTLDNGGYIGSNSVTIKTNSRFSEHSFTLKNSSGVTLRTSSSTTMTASSLSDG